MPAQSISSTQESSRLGIAFATALFLHGAAFAALTLWPSDGAVDPPGEQEITIDLAPAMEELASVAPAEVSAQEAPLEEAVQAAQTEEAEALPPEEVAEDRPQEAEAVPEPQQVTEAVPVEAPPVAPETALEPDAVVALPPTETAVAKPPEEKPAPKPVKKPAPAKPVERKPAPRRTVAAQQLPPSEARQGQASASRENTGGSAASADPNALNSYKAKVNAAIRNRLRYPSVAASGTATLRFIVDRSGQIVSASLVGSAGHPALDQAALATARPGSSVPAAPDSLPQQQFPFIVNLRFAPR
jgi:protein TonB